MFSPSLKDIKEIAENDEYKRIPVAYELFSDIATPIEVLRILKGISKHCYMLESIEDSENWGRYSFLGFNPLLEFTCQDGVVQIKGDCNFTKLTEDVVTVNTDNPSEIIRNLIKKNKSPKLDNLPPFTGGFVGYFAYDYIKYAESSLTLDAENQDHFKDIDIMLFDKVIAFDNFRQKIIIIVNMKTDDIENNYKNACKELKEIADLIINGKKSVITPLKLKSDFKPAFSREEYGEMVVKAKDYIRNGDIFQVVLSNRIEAEIEGSLFDTYRVLRTTNPSPYMFYFSSNDIEIAGASPETLVKVNDKKLYTFPLAGTRPRGKTEKEDLELEKDLLADEKELAEHNMLVDLGRNDIGRIAELGSVSVDKYLSIERFSHVMHIGSTVSGILRSDLDSLVALDSILPAGTLSGAPKIRACEIINELENNKRGIYGGAIGYIDLSGNLDTCISIRIAFARNNKVFIRSGAGIVADSVPDKEFDECMNKAAAVINALEIADGGLE
ncbi:MAG: anthranilate synthase component I [Methanobrevibacter millerae]|uniref:Anthranilate synthase component 1 n=1 Tax=Methanobrevibacter millerae TaxID=230361 RepID=A0A8T3VKK6_9EURY|nr:anthranilate synthase component I [Methanobrevibacter millerae]MBE6505210.1 anthranilate synthase component I [Methanobrevibacter millerae]